MLCVSFYLELIFVKDVKKKSGGGGSGSFVCKWLANISNTIYYIGNPFLIACLCQVYQTSDGCRYAVLPPMPLFCSIGLYLCFGTSTMLF